MKLKNRSRPLFGVSIFLQVKKNKANKEVNVLVPFSGFLSFYKALWILAETLHCSRPLFGVSIFLQWKMKLKNGKELVLVPFSGFLSFYRYYCFCDVKILFSSPFRGFYLSTLLDKIDSVVVEAFSSPFRGFYLSTLPSTSLAISVFITYFAA